MLEEASPSPSSSGDEEETWIQWYCGLPQNFMLCEVEKAYIEDSFNLFGVRNYVSGEEYSSALDVILDRRDDVTEVDASLALVYGLIHARYIITANGLSVMKQKFCAGEFGVCPRIFCRGQRVLPVGLCDEPRQGSVKLFCPKCQDVFAPPMNLGFVDAAYFGSTFPHLFCMTYPELVPEKPQTSYVPRVFGFKMHSSCDGKPKTPAAAIAAAAAAAASSNEAPEAVEDAEQGDKRKLLSDDEALNKNVNGRSDSAGKRSRAI